MHHAKLMSDNSSSEVEQLGNKLCCSEDFMTNVLPMPVPNGVKTSVQQALIQWLLEAELLCRLKVVKVTRNFERILDRT